MSEPIKSAAQIAIERFHTIPSPETISLLEVVEKARKLTELDRRLNAAKQRDEVVVFFPDETSEPLSRETFERIKRATNFLDIAEGRLLELARGDETLEDVLRRAVDFSIRCHHGDGRRSFRVAQRGDEDEPWNLATDHNRSRPIRHTLPEAISEAHRIARDCGAGSFEILQVIPCRVDVTVIIDD